MAANEAGSGGRRIARNASSLSEATFERGWTGAIRQSGQSDGADQPV
jgi:hypothetical protein